MPVRYPYPAWATIMQPKPDPQPDPADETLDLSFEAWTLDTTDLDFDEWSNARLERMMNAKRAREAREAERAADFEEQRLRGLPSKTYTDAHPNI